MRLEIYHFGRGKVYRFQTRRQGSIYLSENHTPPPPEQGSIYLSKNHTPPPPPRRYFPPPAIHQIYFSSRHPLWPYFRPFSHLCYHFHCNFPLSTCLTFFFHIFLFFLLIRNFYLIFFLKFSIHSVGAVHLKNHVPSQKFQPPQSSGETPVTVEISRTPVFILILSHVQISRVISVAHGLLVHALLSNTRVSPTRSPAVRVKHRSSVVGCVAAC
jgi:hypothetical protein